MATAQVKHHDYHLVDPSPWPVVGSISAFIMALGAITWMHHMTAAAPIIFGVVAGGCFFVTGLKYRLRRQQSVRPSKHRES